MKLLLTLLNSAAESPTTQQPADEPTEPNIESFLNTEQIILGATAQIQNSEAGRGTTFQVEHNGRDYLVTSAHTTNAKDGSSLGFMVDGRPYFLIVKNDKATLAEQLVYNPQGHPCRPVEKSFLPSHPFRDIAVLRPLDESEAAKVMKSIWAHDTAADGELSPRQRMANAFRTAFTFNHFWDSGAMSDAEALSALEGFTLGSLSLQQSESTPPLDFAAALGYHQNRAMRSLLAIHQVELEGGNHYRASLVNPDTPIIKGFSGSAIYRPTPEGYPEVVGITTGISKDSQEVYITSIAYVIEGLMRADALQQATQTIDRLDEATRIKVCPVEANNGPDIWLTPDGTPLEASIAMAGPATR